MLNKVSRPSVAGGVRQIKQERCVIVPVSTGFQEDSVIEALVKLRAQGVRVWLVGTSGTSVRGSHGITMAVDKRMSQLTSLHPGSIVLLTGGNRNIRGVMQAVGTWGLLKELQSTKGLIGVTADVAGYLQNAELVKNLRDLNWLFQGERRLIDFVDDVADLIKQ